MGATENVQLHTQGPARIAEDIGETVVYVGERQIAECFEDGETLNAEDQENARRMVACWNSCQRIPTDLLEELGPVVVEGAIPHHQLTTERNDLYVRLQRVRAELLAEIDGGDECKAHDSMISRLIRFCDGETV